MNHSLGSRFCKLFLFFACGAAQGCRDSQWQQRTWEDVSRTGELIIVTRNSSVSYYSGKDGDDQGYEYDILKSFAKHLSLSARVIVLQDREEAEEVLRKGQADVMAAGWLVEDESFENFLPSPAFDSVTQQIVCRREVGLKSVNDLAEKSVMIPQAHGFDQAAKEILKRVPNAKVYLSKDTSPDQIFQMIWEGGPSCTVGDSQSVQVNRAFMPELSEVLNFGPTRGRVFLFSKEHRKLNKIFSQWLELPTTQRLLRDLQRIYFRGQVQVDYYDKKIFLARLESRLPKFIDYFRKAGRANDIPWHLLAAMGYQESHWDENAESPTGVQGIMMLTKAVAKDLGLQDRTSAEESIFGGARYFSQTLNRLPSFIPRPERFWFGLAAYNVGFGHLQDARKIGVDLNLNINIWSDVRKSLPLLSVEKHFKNTRYGYARGQEPVVYVRRVQGYYDLLKKKIPK